MTDDSEAAVASGDDRTAVADRSYRGQRVLDLVLLAVVAVPALAIGLVCAVAVGSTSRGPVLFRQRRVGHLGTPFVILKFRTMVDDPDGNALVPDDAQITTVGRILRRTSLDELPQLINVVRGEMSLVGPRPTLAYQVERYDERQRVRLSVRPGLTGLAQIEGRNDLDWADRIDKDLDYIDRCSLLVDLRIILHTIPAMFSGSGVDGHAVDDPLSAPPAEGRPAGRSSPDDA